MKAFLFVLGLLLPFTMAAPAQSEDLVLTPVGLRPKSTVIEVPVNGSIQITDTEVHLLDVHKKVVHISKKSDTKVRTNATTGASTPEQSGWISYAYWYRNAYPIYYFLSTWNVPPTPATNHGQTLFWFNGIEPASGAAIFQPVLQWGPSAAGGGAYYAVATWYVTGSAAYYTPLVSVSVGQALEGIIELNGSQNSDGTFNYVSGFANIAWSLYLYNSPELVWATETLESYGVTTYTDYPRGCTYFYNIDLYTTGGVPSVNWGVVNDVADGIYSYVLINGATNAEVAVCYQY